MRRHLPVEGTVTEFEWSDEFEMYIQGDTHHAVFCGCRSFWRLQYGHPRGWIERLLGIQH